MGAESTCSLQRGRRSIPGRALLESDHLLFRGESERLKIKFAEVARSEVRSDALILEAKGETYTLKLPSGTASKWLDKLRNPRSLLDKLGVKEGMKVVVLSIADADFTRQLEARVGSFSQRVGRGTDLVFYGVETLAGLERLASLRESLVSNGAIWVVHRKGKEASLRDTDVFGAAKGAGLVDNKVVAFSATHTAERLVIPKALRAPK